MRHKLRQISWHKRWLLLEATIWLALARLSLLLVPFRKLAPWLGQHQQASAPATTPYNEERAEQIGWAVRAIARRTPWESACLAQAISAKMMLRRRRITSTLYLGLAKGDAQKMEAHAWLRCGAEIITGKAGHERFSVISFFGDAEAEPATKMEGGVSDKIQSLLLSALNPQLNRETAVLLKTLTEAEWHELIQNAQQQHIATLLTARLEALGVETAVPTPLWAQLQEKQKQITLQNMATYRELSLISKAMQAEEIPMVVLKGGYLATAVYPHIGQRAMGDLDLLVTQENVLRMVEILHKLGWKETRPLAVNPNMEQHYHLPPFAKKGANIVVEPHWNIVLPERPYSIQPDHLWQHTMHFNANGSKLLAFQPHLQLLHLALHASYNHQFAFDLRSLCDIALLIEKWGEELQWELVVTCAKSWHWQRGVYLTLALVNEFWKTAVPSHILSQLKPDQVPENLLNLTKEHLLWGRTKNKKVSKNFSKLSNTNTFPQKVIFALSFLAPSRKRLAWRYGVPLNSPKIWYYYLVNFRDMIRRNARRSWYLLRGEQNVVKTADRRNQLASWLGESQ